MDGNNIKGKNVLVSLARNEIVFDASFASWAQKDEDILGEKMADFIDRQVKSATAVLQTKISYAVVSRSQIRTDDIREHQDGWLIKLCFPKEWTGSAELLQDHVHQYVADYVILKWMKAKAKTREERMVVADKQQEVDEALIDVMNEAYKMSVKCPSWNISNA